MVTISPLPLQCLYKSLPSPFLLAGGWSYGVWTIGRKTISRQRTIGRGGQSVAEGQSVAKDNRSLKDDRSQTIGRRVKILKLHILMANSEYKKIGN